MANKRKVQSKSKSVLKGKTKSKKKLSSKEQFKQMSVFFSKSHSEKVHSELSSFFARAAKKKAHKKKLTKEQRIKKYQKYKTIVAKEEAEREKQFDLRYSPNVLVPYLYEEWRNNQPNKEEYPQSPKEFFNNWEATKKAEGKETSEGGDGRKKKAREWAKEKYLHAKKQIPLMEKNHDFLPLESEKSAKKSLTQQDIDKKTELGTTGYLTKDEKGNDIEITHLINYQPSAIPIYENPILAELAKDDGYVSEIHLDYDKEQNQAELRHYSRIYPESKANEFVSILNDNGFTYAKWNQKGTRDYNEERIAKTLKDLRNKGFTTSISSRIPPPEPIKFKEPKGNNRFDVFLKVDRSTFDVNVSGAKANEFLRKLDEKTRTRMRQGDQEAYIRQLPEVKTMFSYMTEQGLDKDKQEKWLKDNWKRLLPSDKMWHFVNIEDQKIPIGFVYHYALDFDEYNVKITDNRPLYLDRRSPLQVELEEGFTLRDYQREAIDSAIAKKSGVVAAATGSGKTLIGSYIIAGQGLDTVWFAHTTDLVEQAEERMEKSLGKNVGIYLSDKKEIVNTPDTDINVVTVQSAAAIMKKPRSEHQAKITTLERHLRRLDTQIDNASNSQTKSLLEKERDDVKEGVRTKLTNARMTLQLYDFLQKANVQVFDESHHMKANLFADIAKNTPSARYRYGLSATPWGNTSTDMKRIESVLGNAVASVTATELIEKGFLAKPNVLMVDLPSVVNSSADIYQAGAKKYYVDPVTKKRIKRKTGYNAMDENAVVYSDKFNDRIVDYTIDSLDSGLTTLVLCRRVDHGNNIVEKLRENDIRVDHLNAKELSRSDQRVILNRFKDKETDVLVATIGKAGEGVDFPHLDCVILAHGGKSLVQTMQRVGRAMRIPNDSTKKECVIIDFDRHEKFLDKQSDARRKIYSIEPAFEVRGIEVDAVREELQRVAKVNKVPNRQKSDYIETEVQSEFLPTEFTRMTSSERKRFQELERNIERLERLGTLEKTRKGRKLVISREAKKITSRHPNISPVYAQQILNLVNIKNIDYQTINWNNIDDSLEPKEAIKAAGIMM